MNYIVMTSDDTVSLVNVETGETKWSSGPADPDRAVEPLQEASEAIDYLLGCARSRGADPRKLQNARTLARAGLRALADLATSDGDPDLHQRIGDAVDRLYRGHHGKDAASIDRQCVEAIEDAARIHYRFLTVNEEEGRAEIDLYSNVIDEFRVAFGVPSIGHALTAEELSDVEVLELTKRWRANRVLTKRVAMYIKLREKLAGRGHPTLADRTAKSIQLVFAREPKPVGEPQPPKAPKERPPPKGGTARPGDAVAKLGKRPPK